MSTLHYHKKNQQFWSQYSSVPDGISAYTKRKTMYFAVCSSIPQLGIQISRILIYLPSCNMPYFFRAVEVVDIDNFACLVPLHVPTIYSKVKW